MGKGKRLATRALSFCLPLVLLFGFLIFPFYWIFITSIKPESELYGGTVTYWPKNPTFDAYRALFVDYNFVKPMTNSFIVAASATLLTLFVATLAAYAFSRFRFKGRRPLMIMFLTNNMFPTVLLLIPLYAIMRRLGILYTLWRLFCRTPPLPYNFSLAAQQVSEHLPMSLEEALLDGKKQAQVCEISSGACACLCDRVYIFMNAWNEYTFAVMFTNEKADIPVSLET